jgi:hypothetical protein
VENIWTWPADARHSKLGACWRQNKQRRKSLINNGLRRGDCKHSFFFYRLIKLWAYVDKIR